MRRQRGFIIDPFRFGGVVNDPEWLNVSLLMGFEGVSGSGTFTDESPDARAYSPSGGAIISNAQQKFGANGGFFDGTDDVVAPGAGNIADFRAQGDITCEVWIRPAAVADYCVLGQRDQGSGTGWEFFTASDGSFYLQATTGTPTFVTSAAGLIQATTWQHIAWTKSGTTIRIFYNGNLEGTGTPGISNDTVTPFNIGARYGTAPNYRFSGYMDELRITTGVARYTASFTAPTAAFPRS